MYSARAVWCNIAFVGYLRSTKTNKMKKKSATKGDTGKVVNRSRESRELMDHPTY